MIETLWNAAKGGNVTAMKSCLALNDRDSSPKAIARPRAKPKLGKKEQALIDATPPLMLAAGLNWSDIERHVEFCPLGLGREAEDRALLVPDLPLKRKRKCQFSESKNTRKLGGHAPHQARGCVRSHGAFGRLGPLAEHASPAVLVRSRVKHEIAPR
jgi:hypothetical protein